MNSLSHLTRRFSEPPVHGYSDDSHLFCESGEGFGGYDVLFNEASEYGDSEEPFMSFSQVNGCGGDYA